MLQKSLEAIIKKRLQRYKTETVLLWLIIAVGTFLILSGIGIYFHVGKLTITQYISTISAKDFITNQVEMLCDFAKALGIVFSLIGVVAIIVALDRLSLKRDAYRLASFIRGLKEEKTS